MPRVNAVQTSFAMGELSPRMHSRPEISGYREGAAILEGCVPLPQGPFKRRGGIAFTQQLPAGILQAKIVPFPVSADDYFILVFYDAQLLVLDKFGSIVAPELVLNPKFNSGGTSWTPFEPGAATVTFSLVSCSMNPAATAGNAAIRQNVTGLTVGQVHRFRATQQAPNRTLRLRVGNSAGSFEIGTVTGSGTTVVFDFTPTATSHWIEVASMSINVVAVLVEVNVQNNSGAATPIASPFLAATLASIHYEQAPAGQVMMLTDGQVPVQQFTYTAPATFALVPAPFVSPPAEWVAGSYPRTLTFYQGRFYLGGTRDAPAKFWASKSGTILDFTLGALADDAIAYTIAKRGAIRWMNGLKALLIGTESQELAVSAEGGVITPTDVVLDPQSGYGSRGIQPALLGNQLLYVTADGRKLYSMGYRFEESGWVSTDLTFAAEHITVGRLAAEGFAQNPDSILWFTEGQGNLVGCSYDRGNKIVGWHRHPSLLKFLSVGTVKLLGTDLTWFAYTLELNGNPVVQIGVMPGISLSGRGVFMDSYKRVALPAVSIVFQGFQHLALKDVQIVADGSVRPNVVVAADGSITLPGPAVYEIVAGLKNTCRFVSLPIEPGIAAQPSQPSVKRSNRIFVQLLEGCRPKINGKRPPDRTPSTPMGEREPNRTELVFVSNLGWDRQETVTVEEDLPIEMSVGGIYVELAEEQS